MKRWMVLPVFAMLSACNVLQSKPPVTLYAPAPVFVDARQGETMPWRLSVGRPLASGPLASPRILVRPVPEEIEVYPQAQWSEPAPGLIGMALLGALEADGRIAGVTRASIGLSSDFELVTELRDFQIELSAGPAAVLRIKADLIAYPEGRIVASRLFEARAPAAGQDVASAVTAFSAVLGQVTRQIADWTVAEGEAAYRRASPH